MSTTVPSGASAGIRRRTVVVAAVEPPCEVINECGAVLLQGVSHAEACRIIDDHQAAPVVPPEWHGDMRIKPARRAAGVECDVIVAQWAGRLIVRCDIRHFMPSGLTVAALLDQLRPELEAAVCDSGRPPVPQHAAIWIGAGVDDPDISLLYCDLAECMVDLDVSLRQVQATWERAIADQRKWGGV